MELVDVAPTVLDYLGIVVPSSMQGRSLKKLVARPERHHKEWTLSEATCLGPEVKTLRSPDIKYVATYEARGEERAGVPGPLLSDELYDLASDPGETRSLPGPRLRRSCAPSSRRAPRTWSETRSEPPRLRSALRPSSGCGAWDTSSRRRPRAGGSAHLWLRRGVAHDPAPEGPVLARHLHEVHEDVLLAQAGRGPPAAPRSAA